MARSSPDIAVDGHCLIRHLALPSSWQPAWPFHPGCVEVTSCQLIQPINVPLVGPRHQMPAGALGYLDRATAQWIMDVGHALAYSHLASAPLHAMQSLSYHAASMETNIFRRRKAMARRCRFACIQARAHSGAPSRVAKPRVRGRVHPRSSVVPVVVP